MASEARAAWRNLTGSEAWAAWRKLTRNGVLAAGAIFAAVFLTLLLLDGNRLVPAPNDEGIYLDAAERMLHGQAPYQDFFANVTPAVYWVQEAFFAVFGLTMTAARLPVLLYFAAQCSLLYWLVVRLASRAAAAFATVLFFAIEASDFNFLTAQHRWDSGTWALAGVTLAIHGHFSKRRWPWVASGVLLMGAAFFTPTMLLLTVMTGCWLAITHKLKPAFPVAAASFAAGAGIATAGLAAFAAASRLLAPMLDQLTWLRSHYPAVNSMPYGSIIGGYRNLIDGPADASMAARVLIVLCLALPAILPIANAVGWIDALVFRPQTVPDPAHRKAITYLLLCTAAMVASTHPRSDVMHLAWVAPISYALAAVLFARVLPGQAQGAAVTVGIAGGSLMLAHLVFSLPAVDMASPVGEIRVPQDSAPQVQALLAMVQPGDSAYVYPYKPLLYFLTQTVNPTRYSYLGPGMMTDADQQSVLQDLSQAPPQWVMRLPLSEEEYLRVFPSADPSTVHFRELEGWIDSHYAPAEPAVEFAGYRLLHFRPGAR